MRPPATAVATFWSGSLGSSFRCGGWCSSSLSWSDWRPTFVPSFESRPTPPMTPHRSN
jgi:hypothetical protein